MAGLLANRALLDQGMGQAVANLAAAAAACVQYNTMLNDPDRVGGHDGLVAMGYTDTITIGETTIAEADLILAAFADLTALAAVAKGQAPVPAPNDFFYHAKKLLGVQALPL